MHKAATAARRQMDSCLIQYNTHIPSCFPANDFKTTTFIWNPFKYQTRKHWVCDKTCFSSLLPPATNLFKTTDCFTGEKPLLLATKLLWAHTQNANPRSGQAILDGMASPSNYHSKLFCNNLSEKSKAEVQQLVCCLDCTLATWLLPGQPMVENESCLFPFWNGTNI